MRFLHRALLCALSTGAFTMACNDSGHAQTPTPDAPNLQRIRVGMVLSLSGALANGDEAKRGAEVAVAQINAYGGVLGKRLELVIVDDQSNDAIARQKVQEMADNGIVLGIGPSTNGAAVAMKELVAQGKILYITPSATSPVLNTLADGAKEPTSIEDEGKEPVFFRTAATDSFQATAIVQFASDYVNGVRRCNDIVIIAQGDAYGRPIADKIRDRYMLANLGVKDRVELDPNLNKSALESAAQRVGESGAKCQVVIAQAQVAGAYMRAFKVHQESVPSRDWSAFLTIGSDGLRQNQFIVAGRNDAANTSLPTAGEGGYTLAADTAPETQYSTPEFSAFLNLYNARFPGQDAGRYASTAYDATMLLAGALEKTRSETDIPAIRKSLFTISQGRIIVGPNKVSDYFELIRRGEDINYEGASGPCDFLPNGSVRSDFAVWQIVNAAFERKDTILAGVLTE